MKFLKAWKFIEACKTLENEMYMDKVKEGVNGVEWLVLQTDPDELMMESLDSFIRLMTGVYKFDIHELFKEAMTMNHSDFYKKNNLNWWSTVSEALTYLSLLRRSNYDMYSDFIKSVSDEFNKKESGLEIGDNRETSPRNM